MTDMTVTSASRRKATSRAGRIAALVLLIALVTLAAAWGFQLIGGYQPCVLCYQQRWAWYAVAPLCFFLAVLAEWRGGALGVIRIGLALAGLILLAGAGLAIYHVGVEWGLWQGPQACSGSTLSGGLPDLNKVALVRCGDVQWSFAGLSFAGWNAVLSLITAAIAFKGALRRPR